jgi:hypothetical protein
VHDTCRKVGLPVNSCIEQTRVGVEVARRFGFLFEPVVVSVWVAAGGRHLMVPGPAGMSKRKPGFAGHVIGYFPAAQVAVDLTADQFDVPGAGMPFREPIGFPVERDQLPLGVKLTMVERQHLSITYQELAGDISYRSEEAWVQPPGPVADLVELNLRAALAGTPTAATVALARQGRVGPARRRARTHDRCGARGIGPRAPPSMVSGRAYQALRALSGGLRRGRWCTP